MSALSKSVVEKFCEVCDWTFQAWQMRKYLFDENPAPAILKSPRHAHFFNRLAHITQEHWLLQLAKLHDPPVQANQINLSLDYIISFGGWNDATRQELQVLGHRLAALAQKIKGARNKIISHNDLATMIDDRTMGAFEPEADIAYFEALQAFVNIVHDRTIGGPRPLDDLVRNDIECFMADFMKGAAQLPVAADAPQAARR